MTLKNMVYFWANFRQPVVWRVRQIYPYRVDILDDTRNCFNHEIIIEKGRFPQ